MATTFVAVLALFRPWSFFESCSNPQTDSTADAGKSTREPTVRLCEGDPGCQRLRGQLLERYFTPEPKDDKTIFPFSFETAPSSVAQMSNEELDDYGGSLLIDLDWPFTPKTEKLKGLKAFIEVTKERWGRKWGRKSEEPIPWLFPYQDQDECFFLAIRSLLCSTGEEGLAVAEQLLQTGIIESTSYKGTLYMAVYKSPYRSQGAILAQCPDLELEPPDCNEKLIQVMGRARNEGWVMAPAHDGSLVIDRQLEFLRQQHSHDPKIEEIVTKALAGEY